MKRRSGFTLVELLVVISIIAVLMTIVVGVIGQFLAMGRDAATKTTLNKIQGLLNSRMQAFDRQIKRNGYLTGTNEYQNVQSSYGSLPNSTQKILTTKILEAKFFPQKVAEAAAFPQFYNKSAGAVGLINNSGTVTNEMVLYDFLTQSNALGAAPVNQDAFSAAETQTDATTGLSYFVDAWGTPIRFYRWPTRLFCNLGQMATDAYGNTIPSTISATDIANARVVFATLPVFSGNLANDLARDPDDPLRECVYNFQGGAGKPPIFENLVDANYGIQMHTPATYWAMMVVSAGPDKTFGMYSPEFIDTAAFIRGDLGQVQYPEALTDDIVSVNIRAGGK